jgi:glycosyl transferase family 87
MRHPTRWAGAYALLAAMLASIFAFAILTGPYRAVERSDYMTYHVAGRIVVEARGDCLYTVECQARVQRSLIGEEPSFSDSTLPFTSPPWLAMLVLPLQLLSLAAAFGIFTAVSLLLLGIAAWRLAWGGTGTRLVATALVLSAWPTAMGAIRGQSSLGVAALVGLSASAALRGADGRVGLLAGLAAIKPTLLPLWGIRLIIERRWRAIAGAVAVVTLIVLLALVVVSPKAVADYPSYLLNLAGRDNTFGIHVEQMINWRGAAARLGLADSPLGAVGTLLTLALVTLGWWWARDADQPWVPPSPSSPRRSSSRTPTSTRRSSPAWASWSRLPRSKSSDHGSRARRSACRPCSGWAPSSRGRHRAGSSSPRSSAACSPLPGSRGASVRGTSVGVR